MTKDKPKPGINQLSLFKGSQTSRDITSIDNSLLSQGKGPRILDLSKKTFKLNKPRKVSNEMILTQNH